MMNPAEVEGLVQSLKPYPIEEVGSQGWKGQRDVVERLNHATHLNAKEKKDDYVMQALIAHDKLPVLLHELLVCELWRQRVMGKIVPALIENPTALYMYCYYESVLVNLFECLMFFEEVVVALGDDLLELIDYAWRNLSVSFSRGREINEIPEDPQAEDEGPKRFWFQANSLHSNITMACVSLLWFVVDRLKSLPLAVMNNVLQKNDLVCGIAEILDLQPWMRRDVKAKRIQKFRQGRFEDIKAEDQLVVVGPEAHAWFILHYLLCDRDARTKYQYTKSKKEQILKVKKYLHETLIDQLPALVDVQRALEELSFLEPPTGTEEKFKQSLLIDQVPRLMSSIEGGKTKKSWDNIAEQMTRLLTNPEVRMEDARRYASMFDELYQEA